MNFKKINKFVVVVMTIFVLIWATSGYSETVLSDTDITISGISVLLKSGGIWSGSMDGGGNDLTNIDDMNATEFYQNGVAVLDVDDNTTMTNYVDAQDTTYNTSMKTYVDTRDALKLNLAGGTMTGKLSIDQNTDDSAIYVDAETNGASKYPIHYYLHDSTDGMLYQTHSTNQYWNIMRTQNDVATNRIYRNLGSADTGGAVLSVVQDNSTDDQPTISSQQDGTGDNLFLDTNSNAISLDIDSESTTKPALNIQNIPSNIGIQLADGDYINWTGGAKITGNSTCLILTSPSGTTELTVCD